MQGDSLVDERNPSLEAVASENEVSDIVRQAVEALPQPKRSAVVLRYFGHCSQKEIARRLGISAGTVKSRLFRAHADLSPGLEPLVREHARATPRPDREPRPRREPVLAG